MYFRFLYFSLQFFCGFCFFVFIFLFPVFLKKTSSKPINMGSTFEDLDAKNATMKMVHDSDAHLTDKTFWKNESTKKYKTHRLRQGHTCIEPLVTTREGVIFARGTLKLVILGHHSRLLRAYNRAPQTLPIHSGRRPDHFLPPNRTYTSRLYGTLPSSYVGRIGGHPDTPATSGR